MKAQRPRISKGVLIASTRGSKDPMFYRFSTIVEYFRPLTYDRVRRIAIPNEVIIPKRKTIYNLFKEVTPEMC